MESTKTSVPQLFYEYKLYKMFQGGSGIPQAYSFSTVGNLNVMVMDLLGPSLENLFDQCGRRFSLKTVIMLSVQILRRIEYIHSKCFVHRDIKPDNFLMGVGEFSSKVFVIDFGLAKRYREAKTGIHIPYKDKIDFTGTPRYASINALVGRQQSRRDDLESAIYMMLYFLKGRLPWQGLQVNSNEERYRRIAEIKQNTPLEELCAGLPHEFVEMLSYVRSIEFDETPDYSKLQQLLKQVFVREKYLNDGVYDWVIRRRSKAHYQQPQAVPAEQQKPAGEKTTKQYDPKKSFLQPIPPFNPNNRKRLEEKEREKALLKEKEENSKHVELEKEADKQMDVEKEENEPKPIETEKPNDVERAAL